MHEEYVFDLDSYHAPEIVQGEQRLHGSRFETHRPLSRLFGSSGTVPLLGAQMRSYNMCEKCIELDEKISHYERLSLAVSDELTLDRIRDAVEQFKAAKAALHPEKER
jgi:hypothetical protein